MANYIGIIQPLRQHQQGLHAFIDGYNFKIKRDLPLNKDKRLNDTGKNILCMSLNEIKKIWATITNQPFPHNLNKRQIAFMLLIFFLLVNQLRIE